MVGMGFVVLQLVGLCLVGAEPCDLGPAVRVTVCRVIDGDTIRADIHLGEGVTLDDRSIRALGYDAWETSRRRRSVRVTDEEIAKGKMATAALKELFARGEVWVRICKKRDKWGRRLAELTVRTADGELDISQEMKRGGHVRNIGRGQ